LGDAEREYRTWRVGHDRWMTWFLGAVLARVR